MQVTAGSVSVPWNWMRPWMPASVSFFMQSGTCFASSFASHSTSSAPASAAWARIPSETWKTYGTISPKDR